MTVLTLPDRLSWRAGVEWGLLGLARLHREHPHLRAETTREGPFLEAVATAVHQLGLDDVVRFADISRVETGRIVLLPRVYPSGEGIEGWLAAGHVVISSDMAVAIEHRNLHRFPRRDVPALVAAMRTVLGPNG